jgi:hypothetical protein
MAIFPNCRRFSFEEGASASRTEKERSSVAADEEEEGRAARPAALMLVADLGIDRARLVFGVCCCPRGARLRHLRHPQEVEAPRGEARGGRSFLSC